MTSTSNRNDWVPLALFATTSFIFATFSDVLFANNNIEKDEKGETDSDSDCDDVAYGNLSFRQIYSLRRRRDRLSFDGMTSARFEQHIEPPEEDDEEKSSSHSFSGLARRGKNETSMIDTSATTRTDEASRLQSLSTSASLSTTKLSSEQPANLEEEFTPKNRNWDHFEPYNKEDIQDGSIQQSYASDEDSDQSPEESFVWTSRQRRFERSNHNLPEGEIPSNASSTWARFRSQISRHLSNGYASTESDDNSREGGSLPNLEDKDRYEFGDNANAGDEADAFLQSRQRNLSRKKPRPIRNRSESLPDMLSFEKATKKNEIAQYNARIMPHKVIMVRHGQSEGNVNESLYATTPDNAMRITQLGWEQARMAGKALRKEILASNNEPVHFIVSPYVRTVETFHGIVSAWCDPHEFDYIEDRSERIKAWYGRLLEMGLTWHEDPRIREQDFGNYQDPGTIKRCKKEREKFGSFFYRFPHGESASDVFDRVSTFLDSLWRSFDSRTSRNYVLITHGISVRVFLARYFRYTIEQFSMLSNPRNCEMVMLGHDGAGKLRLQGRCEIELNEETAEDGKVVKKVSGYRFHKRLNVLPKKYIRKVIIRTSYDDVIPDTNSD
mmetsp:Transcript_12979/g.18370  ORF Transcript_12979/g.18370 Transcript_12979/m.18370 type:complete len:612 (+) Transcript_12979:203-2038(+)